MSALMFLSFTGWELVGFALWTVLIFGVWWWSLDREESQAEKDREFARRHRV